MGLNLFGTIQPTKANSRLLSDLKDLRFCQRSPSMTLLLLKELNWWLLNQKDSHNLHPCSKKREKLSLDNRRYLNLKSRSLCNLLWSNMLSSSSNSRFHRSLTRSRNQLAKLQFNSSSNNNKDR
jgi:hypothetical protein